MTTENSPEAAENVQKAMTNPTGEFAQQKESGAEVSDYHPVPMATTDSLTSPLATIPSGSVASQVLGMDSLQAIKGSLWKQELLEESSLTLLDSEADEQLVESFRYLFRAALACGQDPTPLLVTAFKRGKPKLSQEAARLVRDNLNRGLGRALADILTKNPKKFKDALYFFNQPEQARYRPVLSTILLSALLPLTQDKDFRSQLLPSLNVLAPLIAQCAQSNVPQAAKLEEFSELTAFLDALLEHLEEMELMERFAVSAFIAKLAPDFKYLGEYLIKRLDGTNEANMVAFLGNLLARLPKNDDDYQLVKDRMIGLFSEHGHEAGLSRRLRATFKYLGTEILKDLSNPEFLARLNESQRIFVVDMWNDFRSDLPLELKSEAEIEHDRQNKKYQEIEDTETCTCQHEHEHCQVDHVSRSTNNHDLRSRAQDTEQTETNNNKCAHHHSKTAQGSTDILLSQYREWAGSFSRGEAVNSPAFNQLFADFVLNRLFEQDRACVLALVRTHQLDLPVVREALQKLESGRRFIYSFLFSESCTLEDPDDRRVLSLLASCGYPAVEFSFKVISQDAVLESGGEAKKILAFGRLLHCTQLQEDTHRSEMANMVKEALQFPCLQEQDKPNPKHHVINEVWESLGSLGSVVGLPEELRAQITTRLLAKIGANSQPKIAALFAIYRAAGSKVRTTIEQEIRQVLQASEPDRKVLEYSLAELYDLLENGPLLENTAEFVSILCRTILTKSKEPSLESVMQQILSKDAQGDGVQIPKPWSYADRTMALRIIGAAACHPEASERLHNLLVFRIFSFLTDWFEGIEAQKNLYAYRSNPLWTAISELLTKDNSDFTLDLANKAALRLMSCYRKHLEGCDLAQSESAQRFLLSVLQVSQNADVEWGGRKVNIGRVVINTMVEIMRNSPPDNQVAFTLLGDTVKKHFLRQELQEDAEIFLAMHRQD